MEKLNTLAPKLYCSLIALSMKQQRHGSFDFFTISVYLFCVYVDTCMPQPHIWGSEDNLGESDLSFHHDDPGDPTQVVRVGGRCLHWQSPLARLR